MYDQMSLEGANAATIRLVNSSWANYLQRFLHRLKSIGQLYKQDGTLALMQRFRELRPTTYRHSVRVAKFARATGEAFGYDDTKLRQLAQTAVLHDVGKILVPESILSCPRKPTRTERFVLNMHPSFGALLASYFNLPAELRIRTQHHHERWDGRGYPHRLAGEDIPMMARIVQVADTYDAMVSVDRPYRQPLDVNEAVAELRQHEGKQFDPRVIQAFLDTLPAQ
jgi:HD-GYP domain-containing protein (c-di-GMP phosphodiesterase class II)